MPNLEKGVPENLRGEISHQQQGTLELVVEMVGIATTGCIGITRIAPAEVTCQHYLFEEETAVFCIGEKWHAFLVECEHLLHHVHEGLHETQHANTLQQQDTLVHFLGFHILLQNVVVIEYLAHSYTLVKEMTINVYRYVHEIECDCRHREFALWSVDKVDEFMFLTAGEIFLQT